MHVDFTKMHGAGNDFILVDNRDDMFPVTDTGWVQSMASRHSGVGCDGVILVEHSSQQTHFKMRFLNPDGSEVDMCGNGARCIARYAFDRNIAPQTMAFETRAGDIQAEVLDGGDVKLRLSRVAFWERNIQVSTATGELDGQWLNTGVPHAVFLVSDIETFDVAGVGRQIRYAERFQPGGTNADFFECLPDGTLRVRTYERGVEAETLACGTGIAATALCAIDLGMATSPVKLTCQSGDQLEVSFDNEWITLTGPATYVFEGRYLV